MTRKFPVISVRRTIVICLGLSVHQQRQRVQHHARRHTTCTRATPVEPHDKSSQLHRVSAHWGYGIIKATGLLTWVIRTLCGSKAHKSSQV